MLFESKKNQIDDLLVRIGRKLELTKTQEDRVASSYDSVGKWLVKAESPLFNFDPQVFPQGSYKLQTTVKPIGKDEYDIDIVCCLDGAWKSINKPVALLDTLENWMKENGNYKDKIERMNRCIRVNYEGDFHMDILPGFKHQKADCYESTEMLIPDRKLQEWKLTNPKKYAEWFDGKALKTYAIMEREIQPLPVPQRTDLKPILKRLVQLLKRHRDVFFSQGQPEKSAPISIVLTTLAGDTYDARQSGEYLCDALLDFLTKIKKLTQNKNRLKVFNPVCHEEEFTERWDDHPERYTFFIEWIDSFKKDWESILDWNSNIDIVEKLKVLFGEDLTNAVIKEQAEYVNKLREAGQMGILGSTGSLYSTLNSRNTIKVRNNTFYGCMED